VPREELTSPVACRAVTATWHTLIVLLALFGFSFASAHAGSLTPFGPKIGRAFGYIVVIVFEWAVVAFIWFGLGRRGIRIADLVGGNWARSIYILRDIAIAVASLTAGTHTVAGGIVLQAIAFALTHGYQGWRFVLLIAVLATMLGLLAHWRRSLRPGMIAHALQDGITGIAAAHVLR
jgi:hypothetical protein